MDDHKPKKKEDLELIEKKNEYNLRNENEDNTIDINFEKEENTSNNINGFNNTFNFKLKYDELIKQLINTENKYNNEKEFYCNLLLIPSVIDILNKLATFSLITFCYKTNKNNNLIYSVSNKIEKYMFADVKNLNYFFNIFFRASYFLRKDNNYFYAHKYKLLCDSIIEKMPSKSRYDKEKDISDYLSGTQNDLNNYIKKKKDKFINMNNEEYQKIIKIIDLLLSENNSIELINKDNNKYFYVINKNWVIKAKAFIEHFIKNINNQNNYIEEAFDENSVYNFYFEEKEEKDKNIEKKCYPYCGPINNFPLIAFKDSWIDNENLDENIFMKKYLVLNKDYVFISLNDWLFLNNIFDCTNEIMRTKNYLDLIELKFVLFDRQINTRNDNVNLLKQKYIQIDKNSTINQLKEKILNSVHNTLKYDIANEQEVCFYILNKDKKDLLIEIIGSFYLKIKMYESIYIKKIEIEDNNTLDDFFRKYDKKRHILMIEVINKGDFNFLIQMDTNYKCSICDKDLSNLNKKYNCQLCHFSLFCSKECMKNSNEHRNLDNFLNKIIVTKFNLSYFLSTELSSSLISGTLRGRVGLTNSGNTCYFNSVIQCLSNTEDLTKYFLNDCYNIEKNQENNDGFKSEFLKFYGRLISTLWNTTNNSTYDVSLNPKEFKTSFFMKNKSFDNQDNQDAHECLVCILNNLHEDLNRTKTDKKKPEIEGQKEGETDELASKRWWDYSKSIDDSIICDLFKGQYKSTIKCNNCQKKSITYNTFITLGLPIPTKKSQVQIKLLTNKGNYIDISMKVDEKTEMKDFIFKAIKYLNKKDYINNMKKIKIEGCLFNFNITSVPDSILYNNIQVIEFNKDISMINIYNPSYEKASKIYKIDKNLPFDKLKYLELTKKKNTELILYEKDVNSNLDNYINVYVYPVTEIEKEGMMFNIIRVFKLISYPLIISIKNNKSLKELEKMIFEKCKKILHNQVQNSPNYIEICYPHLNEKWENFKIKEGKCPICEKKYDKNTNYCSLFNSVDNNTLIYNFMKEKNNNRPLILFAKSIYYNEKYNLYKGIELFYNKNDIELKSNLNLYDAIDLLNNGEILDGENIPICEGCGKKGKIGQNLEIYKAPYYLIIQIKRFKQKGNKKLSYKNETFIEYKEVLNLKDFVLGPDKDKCIYDLYAVLLNKKFMNSYHYTCYCKNRGLWILYDDKDLKNVENIISKDAYILFYKRRSFD